MRNLRQFIITVKSNGKDSSLIDNLLDGHQWYQLFTNYTPHLNIFDIFVYILHSNPQLDMNGVIHSFEPFTRNYDDFHIAVDQSRYNIYPGSKFCKNICFVEEILIYLNIG
jgi:hypothetical protein